MDTVTALSDASIVYGAQRHYDGLHDQPNWRYRSSYLREDDRALFVELLHNICLYEHVVMDFRPINEFEVEGYQRLMTFMDKVNRILKHEFFIQRPLLPSVTSDDDVSDGYGGNVPAIQDGICKLIAGYVDNRQTERIAAIQVPWAYHQEAHHDRQPIRAALRKYGIEDKWLPFTLFVWRAIWYGACAHAEAKNGRPVAYVAAPKRIRALEAVLDAETIARFKFPREAVRDLSWAMPAIPERGYDFSYLPFLEPFESSALADKVAGMPAPDALDFVARLRGGDESVAMREDWTDILLQGKSTCAVGTVIQIARQVKGGNVSQSVQLRGFPKASKR